MADTFGIIKRASEYIEENLKELTTIDEISSKLKLSSTYLNRVFKRYLGYSGVDYLKMRKITQGILKGSEGRGNIIDIALDYGFSSHEVFTRSCRRYFKESPRELLKSDSWKGCPQIDSNTLWYLTNLKSIEISKVRLPRLELSSIEGGDFTVYTQDMVFTGNKSTLEWDSNRSYKLIPSGVYEQYSIGRYSDYDRLRKYLINKNLPTGVIIEYKKRDRVLFYRNIDLAN